MIIVKTTLEQKISKRPTLLDFKKILYLRGLTTGQADWNEINRLEIGELGEEKFIELLKENGKKHWVVLRNLWMHDFRSFECDLILITNHCIYLFEIKNYRGRYVFQNASSKMDAIDMDYDCIQQARKSFVKTRKIIHQLSPDIPVKGALVFIGEKNQVSIESSVEDIDILTLTDLYVTIREIANEEQYGNYPPLNVNQIIQHLEKFEMIDPFLPKPLNKNELKKLRKGTYCDQCQSFKLQIEKNYVICSCGLHEPREEAIVRMALEYGALTYDRNFTAGNIVNFIDAQASHGYVKKVLSEHFDCIKKNSFTYFEHSKPLYYKSVHDFSFDLPRKYYSERNIHMFK